MSGGWVPLGADQPVPELTGVQVDAEDPGEQFKRVPPADDQEQRA